MNLYVLNYNSYYSRIIRRERTLNDYLNSVVPGITAPIQNVDFKPGNGVDTEIILPTTTYPYFGAGNYLIAAEENGTINSRWFIMDIIRTRVNQYRVTLHRDLIADYYVDVVNATCFVEKATLQVNDPFIFNSEQMTFNKIKRSEILLMDETKSAWVVGFIPNDWTGATVKGKYTITTNDMPVNYTVDGINTWNYYNYITNPTYPGRIFNGYTRYINFKVRMFYRKYNNDLDVYTSSYLESYMETFLYLDSTDIKTYLNFNQNAAAGAYQLTLDTSDEMIDVLTGTEKRLFNEIVQPYQENAATMVDMARSYTSTATTAQSKEFYNLNGKTIRDTTTGTVYRIKVNSGERKETLPITSGNLYSQMNMIKKKWTTPLYDESQVKIEITGTPGANTYYIDYEYVGLTITLEEIKSDSQVVISEDRYHLVDSPYDMFCIPYSNELTIYKNGEIDIAATNKEIALNMASEIGKQGGNGSVYDVMLLPYCPVREYIQNTGEFDIGDAKVSYITDSLNSDNKLSVILWARKSSFSFNIYQPIVVNEPKISNECDKYRICSPNYNGVFEFSPAMNNGVDYFNVDCTYKPFNPYIHINPNFKGLYGQDFNDQLGLICSGDFSLPQVTNAWATYQLQNKNYQESFDRQIMNIEINNATQRLREAIGVGLGTGQGAVGGATSGFMIGGAAGAMGGGIAGGSLSAAAGALDYSLSNLLREETIDYTKDQFGYTLGNIQAIPSSIAKTSALTANNKIFPFLEYYSCTEEEKEALRNKLYYNGMTVMRIGRLGDYINAEASYIKAKLIRLGTELAEDYHVVESIAKELDKGVFI